MILKGSQRSGAGQLAAHLLNDGENDHVTVHELRGYMADDLYGALAETYAVSRGTRCRQYLFSLSLNPPKDAQAGMEDFLTAAERAETALGLKGQPRAIVIHEKNGRRHAHVVWSRIDAFAMKAINMAHFKTKLNRLSRELYLEHGWALPDGFKTNGWKNPLNFTLAEWQQAKRLDLDPREIKQVFQTAWAQSDNQQSFRAALEECGYFLAKGDRRGFVAVDIQGEVYSLSRWAGVKTKQLAAKLGAPDALPGVDTVKAGIERRMTEGVKSVLKQGREAQHQEMLPLMAERRAMVTAQRAERSRLSAGQKKRWEQEAAERAARFRRGLAGVWDILTGRARALRRENEAHAHAGRIRDRQQRETLFRAQAKERGGLQTRITALRQQQAHERRHLIRKITLIMPQRMRPPSARDFGLEP